jgi:hypothetical protein
MKWFLVMLAAYCLVACQHTTSQPLREIERRAHAAAPSLAELRLDAELGEIRLLERKIETLRKHFADDVSPEVDSRANQVRDEVFPTKEYIEAMEAARLALNRWTQALEAELNFYRNYFFRDNFGGSGKQTK